MNEARHNQDSTLGYVYHDCNPNALPLLSCDLSDQA